MRASSFVLLSVVVLVACKDKEPGPWGEKARPDSKKTADTKGAAKPQCGDAPCLDVPTGIKGLSFGMAPEDVRASLAPKSWEPPTEPHWVYARNGTATQFREKVPGTSTRVGTTLGGLGASCRLDFNPELKLAGITCRVNRGDDDLDAFFDTVLASLVGKYGAPHQQSQRRDISMTGRGKRSVNKVQWHSAGASLILWKGENLMRGPESVTLANHSREHTAQLANARRLADRAVIVADEEEQRAAREAEKARQEKIREGKQALDRDLTGAPEQPR